MKQSIDVLVMTVVATAILTQNAHAYLDPGTGSIIIQGAIAAVAGGLFTMKVYWSRLKSYVGGRGKGTSGNAGK